MEFSERLRSWRVSQLLAVLLLGLAGTSANAATGIKVSGAWSRALPPVVKIGAAYLRINNSTSAAVTLVGAEASIAARAELHEHVHVNGMMKMRQLHQVEIPAGDTVPFAPHGLHIMLFDLSESLDAGTDYELTLVFGSGERVRLIVPVRREAP